MVDLHLHTYQNKLSVKTIDQKSFIWCTIRKKFLVLQPEEVVRQLMIFYLIEQGYPAEKIQVEKSFDVNGMMKRFDIVVYDKAIRPHLIVECKAHHHKLNQAVHDQIIIYNLSIDARFFILTNGLFSICYERIGSEINELDKFPIYQR